MKKVHSTLSRRDFMKSLGLAGAGLGAAALTAPVFKDLDHAVSIAANTYKKKPWWVNERDYCDPTTPIDWDIWKSFDAAHYDFIGGQYSDEYLAEIGMPSMIARDAKNRFKNINARLGNPGYSMRDWAFCQGAENVTSAMCYDEFDVARSMFLGDKRMMDMIQAPEDIGIPKYQGTPEENALMLKSVIRFFGGTDIRCLPVDDKTKRLLNVGENQHPDQPYVWEEGITQPYATQAKRAIPTKDAHILVFSYNGSFGGTMRSPSWISNGVAFNQCLSGDSIQLYLQRFMKGLGYWLVGGDDFPGIASYPAAGAMSGLGEVGRIGHTISWDSWMRSTRLMITNLPLPTDNPVDFGAVRFCTNSCKKCADCCPVGAIKKDDEPSWELAVDLGNPLLKPENFNNPGKKTWYLNQAGCFTNWCLTDSFCGICMGSCVFNKLTDSSVHELVKPVVANTSLFNSFFYNMDKAFSYGPLDESKWEDWWTLGDKMPIHGIG
nr:reductive dehalogenase [uncultured bacterium]